MKTIIVTGGAGFIGSNFLNLAVPRFPKRRFVNVDKLTYAGNPLSLEAIETAPNYAFEHADICDGAAMARIFESHDPDAVVHFAAESHVDRSIIKPANFLETNVMGTLTLLEACRTAWQDDRQPLFLHVSTDEVYGSFDQGGYFTETTPYNPSSPYAASKAGSDHLVRAYHRTYQLPIIVTNCSNNYGPYQFPEKLIPLIILRAAEGSPLPVYGSGTNVRDWLHVTDHCEALFSILERGRPGETYNIGGGATKTNLEVVGNICDLVAAKIGKTSDKIRSQITFVEDRPGHDLRYAIDASKLKNELGWTPVESFDSGLRKTTHWYLENATWVSSVRSGAYRNWIETNYRGRMGT